MKYTLNTREKKIIYAAAYMAAFACLVHFLIEPAFSNNMKLNQQIKTTHIKLAKYKNLMRQRQEIQEKYDRLSPLLINIAEENTQTASPLLLLENLAKESNIHVSDIRPQETKQINNYNETNIYLKSEGDIRGYIKFIYSIGRSSSLFAIKKLKLSNQTNTRRLEGVFTITYLSGV